VAEGDASAGDLSEGMHAGIGASGAVNSDRSALEPCERVFEQALDRLTGGLTLPSDESRSIVGQRDLQRAHVYRNALTAFPRGLDRSNA
jgi:hypothetical protein